MNRNASFASRSMFGVGIFDSGLLTVQSPYSHVICIDDDDVGFLGSMHRAETQHN